MAQPPIQMNKLLVLAEIFDAGSVTEAARRLGRTQPSVTSTLNELRAFYGDPLFVRHGNRLKPTGFAESLAEPLQAWRKDAEVLLARRRSFDPSETRRAFRIRASDYHHAVFGSRIAKAIAPWSERLTVEFVQPTASMPVDVRRDRIDLAFHIGPRPPEEFGGREVLKYPYCVLFDPSVRAAPETLEQFAAAHFILASPKGSGASVVDGYLRKKSLRRKVVIRTPQIFDAPRLLAGTSFITVLPWTACAAAVRAFGLRRAKLPFRARPVITHIVWEKRFADDPAAQWMVDAIVETDANDATPAEHS